MAPQPITTQKSKGSFECGAYLCTRKENTNANSQANTYPRGAVHSSATTMTTVQTSLVGEPLNKLWDSHTDVFGNGAFLALGGGLQYRVRYLSQGDCIVWAAHILGVR